MKDLHNYIIHKDSINSNSKQDFDPINNFKRIWNMDIDYSQYGWFEMILKEIDISKYLVNKQNDNNLDNNNLDNSKLDNNNLDNKNLNTNNPDNNTQNLNNFQDEMQNDSPNLSIVTSDDESITDKNQPLNHTIKTQSLNIKFTFDVLMGLILTPIQNVIYNW